MGCLLGLVAPVQARAVSPKTPLPSVAFYYGDAPPLNALQSFDWVVLDAHAALPPPVSGVGLGHPGPTFFGYLSVGEVDPSLASAPAACLIGNNPIWKTQILDLRQATCRDWLITQSVAPMIARGFHHFFLDTLDSNERVLTRPTERAAYDQGIAALMQAIRARAPGATFITNRGFGLLDQAPSLGVVGVAAESLYRGWNQAGQRYVAVSAPDRAWLTQRLNDVRAHGLVPIAIDYTPDDAPELAHRTADQISADGFVPYITNGALNRVGVGAITPQPREILMLYDGDTSPMRTEVTWYVAMVLNHLGYATRAINVDSQPLPATPMNGRIAGVVTWFSGASLAHPQALYAWLRKQIDAGLPVAMLGAFGFPTDAQYLEPLGLSEQSSPDTGKPITVVAQNPQFTGFEALVHPVLDGYTGITLKHGEPLLTVARDGQQEVDVALTPWGGFALSPYVVTLLPQGALQKNQLQNKWVLNPFAFLEAALRLKPMPAFDTTTLSGNRVLFAHIDGDGFSSASYVPAYRGQPAAQVVLEAILKRYRLPVTASVIAGEFVDDALLTAAQVAANTPIAKAIFALPWVEIGSHSYSHAFDWQALEKDPSLSAGLHLQTNAAAGKEGLVAVAGLKYGYNLAIPGYRFDNDTEIGGSARIINQKLAPAGKKTELYQWPGDTDPGPAAVAMAYDAGLLNINGANSTISAQWPSLTNVSPLGVWKGGYFQVYAPDANEDQFTDDWKPPYCGYRKVVQTFGMTESPRRLAPINIYYHFYSGARPCGLDALQSVYAWAVAQSSTPIFTTHYARMVLGFEYAAVAREGDAWVLGGYGADQTVRVPKAMGYPDLTRSRNVVGFSEANEDRYITLGPGGQARLVLKSTVPTQPYLVSANAPINAFERRPGGITLTLAGYVPLKIALGGAAGCAMSLDGTSMTPTARGSQRVIDAPASGGTLEVTCPSR